jgi:hypothetical protein
MKKLFSWLSGKKAPATPYVAPPPFRTMADLDTMIAAGAFEPATAEIRRRVLPCIHVIADGAASDATGITRFGGDPDLPAGSSWPSTPTGVPLQFFAQIDLAALTQQHGSTALPPEGLLSIFAGDLDGAWETRGAAILTLPSQPLQRIRPPMQPHMEPYYPHPETLNAVAVRFEHGLTLPTNDAGLEAEILRLAPEGDLDSLQTSPPAGPDVAIAQLLGHAHETQERLQSLIAFAELGHPGKQNLLHWTSWEDWEAAKKMEHRLRGGTTWRPWRAEDDPVVRWMLDNREAIARETERWQVLLMVQSNKPMNFWINDADPIFVFIRTDDLAARNFSRLRVVATQS